MKKIWMICLTGLLILASGCNKDTASKLEGKWQMQEVEANGIVQQVDTIYYNFLTSLFALQVYNPATNNFRMQYGVKKMSEDDILVMEMTKNGGNRESFLNYVDWEDYTRSFIIEHLSKQKLVLRSIDNDTKYTFRNF